MPKMSRTEPTNKRDRETFAALSEPAQRRVIATADLLYDGTRTVAQCWKDALLFEDVASTLPIGSGWNPGVNQ